MTGAPANDSYKIPVGRQQISYEIKSSRFIATVARAENKVEAQQFIDSVSQQYSDANHNCWAMIAGQPSNVLQQGQSDDGEPKGTAGKPMLNALQHSGLGNIVVVVTRYFGGIKLGAGGLVRAYTRGVTESLTQLETEVRYVCVAAQIKLPYAELDEFQHWLQSTRIKLTGKEFSQEVCLVADVPLQDRALLTEFVGSRKQMAVVWFD